MRAAFLVLKFSLFRGFTRHQIIFYLYEENKTLMIFQFRVKNINLILKIINSKRHRLGLDAFELVADSERLRILD